MPTGRRVRGNRLAALLGENCSQHNGIQPKTTGCTPPCIHGETNCRPARACSHICVQLRCCPSRRPVFLNRRNRSPPSRRCMNQNGSRLTDRFRLLHCRSLKQPRSPRPTPSGGVPTAEGERTFSSLAIATVPHLICTSRSIDPARKFAPSPTRRP